MSETGGTEQDGRRMMARCTDLQEFTLPRVASSPGGAVKCRLQRKKLTLVPAVQWPGFLGPTHCFFAPSVPHLQPHDPEKSCQGGKGRLPSSVEWWWGAIVLGQVIPLRQTHNSKVEAG